MRAPLALADDEFSHGGIRREAPIGTIRPALINDQIYTPVDTDTEAFRDFARDLDATIRVGGRESIAPIVVSEDGVIISGHRRYAYYRLRGHRAVFVERFPLLSTDPRFPDFLVKFNRQREKRADEVFREELVRLDPKEARRRLVAHRQHTLAVKAETMIIHGTKTRAAISGAKAPFVAAVCDIVARLREFWPLSDRLVHYQLLNAPPLKHASKPASGYVNDEKSYKSLVELLTRLRLDGTVPFAAIHDPTRPVTTWDVHPGVRAFARSELDGFLKNYWRDLQRSQPLHIEIIGEKNTVEGTIRPVAADYTIPFMIGRGYSSIPPRYELVQRFQKSGKSKLLLLFLSDCDPEGDDIAHSFTRSVRDDFGVGAVEAVRVALTRDQAERLALPPVAVAKEGSSRRDRFVERHQSEHVWELEAVPPARLQQILREHIEGVLDMNLFRHEEQQEADDAARLDGMREQLREYVTTHFATFADADEGGGRG